MVVAKALPAPELIGPRFTIYHLLFTIHYSPFTIHDSRFTIHDSGLLPILIDSDVNDFSLCDPHPLGR